MDSSLSVYILLDRSGSMQSRWKTSIDSVNEYVNVLRDSGVEGKINFIAFDQNSNQYVRSMTWPASLDVAPVQNSSVLEVVRKDADISTWASLTGHEVSPRGGTPLFDAVVETQSMINNDISDKGIFIIITDGGENASVHNKNAAEAAVNSVKNRNWEVVFLGANFDNSNDARSMGLSPEFYGTYSDSNAVRTMSLLSTKSAAYATSGISVSFTADDKAFMVDEDNK